MIAPHHVSQHHLQKSQVGVVGEAGNADDGQGAGLSRHDRQRNRPPGNIAVGEKVVAQRALPLAEAQAKQRDPRQVQRDDGEIKLVENHKEFVQQQSVWPRATRPRVVRPQLRRAAGCREGVSPSQRTAIPE